MASQSGDLGLLQSTKLRHLADARHVPGPRSCGFHAWINRPSRQRAEACVFETRLAPAERESIQTTPSPAACPIDLGRSRDAGVRLQTFDPEFPSRHGVGRAKARAVAPVHEVVRNAICSEGSRIACIKWRHEFVAVLVWRREGTAGCPPAIRCEADRHPATRRLTDAKHDQSRSFVLESQVS